MALSGTAPEEVRRLAVPNSVRYETSEGEEDVAACREDPFATCWMRASAAKTEVAASSVSDVGLQLQIEALSSDLPPHKWSTLLGSGDEVHRLIRSRQGSACISAELRGNVDTNDTPRAPQVSCQVILECAADKSLEASVPTNQFARLKSDEECQRVKRERRKEQCRVNQARYRKRKHTIEMQIQDDIKRLEVQVDRLREQRELLRAGKSCMQGSSQAERFYIRQIREFYRSFSLFPPVGLHTMHPMKDTGVNHVRKSNSVVVELQYEEYASLAALESRWRHYRQLMRVFHLDVTSMMERMIDDQVIVLVKADLSCRIRARSKWIGVVCPVFQRFEVGVSNHGITRIVSEVEWVAGACRRSISPILIMDELASRSTDEHCSFSTRGTVRTGSVPPRSACSGPAFDQSRSDKRSSSPRLTRACEATRHSEINAPMVVPIGAVRTIAVRS